MNCSECDGKLFSLFSKQAGICHECIEIDYEQLPELEDRLEEALEAA